MAFNVSPGVYTNVFDFSTYAPQLGKTTVCIVGGASKGPVGVPTLNTDEAALVRNFGPPLLTDYALQAAVQALKGGANVIFIRVVNGAATATVPVPGLAAGTPAAVATGSVSFTGSNNPADGDLVKIRSFVPALALNADGVGAAQNVTITKSGSNIAVSGMSGGTVSARATGQVKLLDGAQPSDGDTVTIGDGSTSVVFEFDSNSSVSGGNTAVTIGSDAYATMANLKTAINASALVISAVESWDEVIFEFDDDNSYTGGHVAVLVGATAAASLLNLLAAINTNSATLGLVASNNTVSVPALALTADAGGADYNAPVATTGGNIGVSGMSGGTDAVAGSSVNVLLLDAANPGSWGNDLQVVVRATTVITGAVAGGFDLLVYAPIDLSGTLGQVERFNNLSTDSSNARFVETVLSEGIRGEVGASKFIVADVTSSSGSVTAGTYTLGTGGGTVGTDGVSGLTADDYIGTFSGQTATGLKAARNPEKIDFNVVMCPGVTDEAVIAELKDLCLFRNDCMAVIDPPFAASVQQVVDWHNGVSDDFANAPEAALDSSVLALYWPWVKAEDAYNKKTVFLPPSGFVAAAWAHTDAGPGPWWAPAGPDLGALNAALAVEYSPNQEERDLLVGDHNHVNPIVDFASGGVMLYGNRTLQRKNTYLDSINVQRMMLYATKLVATAIRTLVFAPNDPVTWVKFTALVNPILETIKQGRGLTLYKVICDKTTNPDAQIANKVMKGLIQIQPTPAAEIIEVDFSLFASSSQFSVSQ